MNGLSCMKRTASTSSSILAVSSAISVLSGNAVTAGMVLPLTPLSSPGLTGRSSRCPAALWWLLDARFRGHDKRKVDAGNRISADNLPLDGFAAAIDQRLLVRARDLDLLRRGPGDFSSVIALLVRRQP